MTTEFYTEYFIDENGEKSGPYDAMTMVRRIRNGKIGPETPVFAGEAYAPVAAGELPEFQVFFDNPDAAEDALPPMADGPLDLGEMLKDAWSFFSDNQLLSLAAGVLLVGGVIAMLLLSLLLPAVLAAALGSVIGGVLLYLYLIYVAMIITGKPIDNIFLVDLAKNRGVDLLAASALTAGLCFGIPAMIGVFVPDLGFFLMLAGLIGYAFFIFTPLFLLNDPTLRFPQALRMSKGWLLSQSINNIAIVVALVAINVVASFLFFLPVFVSLPVTFIALADLFLQRAER